MSVPWKILNSYVQIMIEIRGKQNRLNRNWMAIFALKSESKVNLSRDFYKFTEY